MNWRMINESERDGRLLATFRKMLADYCPGFHEDGDVKNDANHSQNGIPDKNPVHLRQIDCATTDGSGARPKRAGNDDKRQSRGAQE